MRATCLVAQLLPLCVPARCPPHPYTALQGLCAGLAALYGERHALAQTVQDTESLLRCAEAGICQSLALLVLVSVGGSLCSPFYGLVNATSSRVNCYRNSYVPFYNYPGQWTAGTVLLLLLCIMAEWLSNTLHALLLLHSKHVYMLGQILMVEGWQARVARIRVNGVYYCFSDMLMEDVLTGGRHTAECWQ
jgi:hypothetical protein